MKKLSIGYSTCPNDTFIFDAMVHGKINTEGLSFEPVLEDVEKLNTRAFQEELDITKISYHTWVYLQKSYSLLNSGSALGNNCGPILISKYELNPLQLVPEKIGIPGKFTTANLLLQLFLGKRMNAKEFLFSDIETALLNEEIDAGVIIHESRFTYEHKGLKKIQDLGEYWEKTTGLPIPLGGIVVRKELGTDLKDTIDRILKRSVQYAFDHPGSSRDYVKKHAQEMSEDVMNSHIALYVNAHTLDLGEVGNKAVSRLMTAAAELP